MQRLLELLNKLSPADWVVAASASLLGAVLSGTKDARGAAAYFLSGLICGLVFPPWIAHFVWKYPEPLHIGVVAILAISGYNIIQWIRGGVRDFLKRRKLSVDELNRRKRNDD